MGLIQNSVLSGLCDRVASQASCMETGFNNAIATGLPHYPRIHQGVPTGGDFDVENALISAANGVDTNTFSGAAFKSFYQTYMNALETHGLNKNAASFQSWLNISGINVHPQFDDVWYACKSVHMDARNVFFSDANILVATYGATASGTGVFTAGTAVGTGTGTVSPTNHAAAKMVLIPVKDTSADIQLNLSLTKENLAGGTNTDSENIRIPSGTTSGTQFIIKNWVASGLNSQTNMFLDVSNIVAAGGGSGNHFRVYALLERAISL